MVLNSVIQDSFVNIIQLSCRCNADTDGRAQVRERDATIPLITSTKSIWFGLSVECVHGLLKCMNYKYTNIVLLGVDRSIFEFNVKLFLMRATRT